MLIFYIIFVMITPLIMISFGGHWRNHIPGKINMIYGYRTTWSMKSQETWNFAHKYFGRIWFLLGILLALISVPIVVIFARSDSEIQGKIFTIIMVVQMLALMVPIVPTELRLRRMFDETGKIK